MKKLKLKKISIGDILMLALFLFFVSIAIYIDYPNFKGFKMCADHFKEFLSSVYFLWVLGISCIMSLIAYLLSLSLSKHMKYVNSLKDGDKVKYNGSDGVVKSIPNENEIIIEIKVPKVSLSKFK